ncbi:MAG TPA: hypothetical protein VHM20_01565 [Gammaproteobacteria bacterium]|jgi:hypothetical protein|nr:hypothetical protein [Gammaproteobacteria bacterium]
MQNVAEKTLEKVINVHTPKLLSNATKVGAGLGAAVYGIPAASRAAKKSREEGDCLPIAALESSIHLVGRGIEGGLKGAAYGFGAGILLKVGVTFFTPLDVLRKVKMTEEVVKTVAKSAKP